MVQIMKQKSLRRVQQTVYYFDPAFFINIIFDLLIVKIYVSFLKKIHFELKNNKVLTFNIVHFCNFRISASL